MTTFRILAATALLAVASLGPMLAVTTPAGAQERYEPYWKR